MSHFPPSNSALPTQIPDQRLIPARDFNQPRQDFLRRFNVWLMTSADLTAALLELESTVNATRGLVALAFNNLENHPLISGASTVKRDAQ